LCTNGTYLNRFEATLKGLNKLLLNEPKFHEDLEKNQLLLKQFKPSREGYPNPYEALKGLTRTNEAIDKSMLALYT
jgi:adenylosuccinate lyase